MISLSCALIGFGVGVLVGVPIGSWGLLVLTHGYQAVRQEMSRAKPGLIVIDGGRK